MTDHHNEFGLSQNDKEWFRFHAAWLEEHAARSNCIATGAGGLKKARRRERFLDGVQTKGGAR